MDAENLAKRLKELRAQRGMSQEYLAEESRVSLRTIQRIENKESAPTGETIKRISVALDVELNEILGSDSFQETSDLKGTIIFLKKRLSKTSIKSEVKTLKQFIKILNNLKEKQLTEEQLNGIEDYIRYLELEKIPSFSNEIFEQKLAKLTKHLKTNLKFVPFNYYTKLGFSFAIPFSIGFGLAGGISIANKIIVILAILSLIGVGRIVDLKMKKQKRSFSF